MSEEIVQIALDLSHVFELLSNKKNDILNIDYSNDSNSYPTVRAVKNYVDNAVLNVTDLQTMINSKASTTDLINGLQNIGAYTIHTVYNVSGNASAYDISSGLLYTQQSPVFFLVKNNIGDNNANATLKYYPNGDNITIIDTFSNNHTASPIQQGVWKKDTWALFFCVGNNTVELRSVFYDSNYIDERNFDLSELELIDSTHSLASTANWTGTSTRLTSLTKGTRILYRLTYVPTARGQGGAGLSIQFTDNTHSGYKPIRFADGTQAYNKWFLNSIAKNDVLLLEYNGTNWVLLDFFAIGDRPNVARTGSYNDLSDKPTIPSASLTTPSADTASGSIGTGTAWARSDHTHPKSSLYAEANHTHSQYLTEHQSLANYVTTDDSRLSELGTGSFTELQALITGASSGDTIVLEKDYKNTGSEAQITIDKTLTIVGNGHTLDADNVSRCIQVSASDVVLTGLYFVNGNATVYDSYTSGGGVYCPNGNSATIIDCHFNDCSASTGGGAYLYSSTLSDCSFNNCSTSLWAGGVILYSSSTASDCSFTDCSATRNGGGVSLYNSSTVSDSFFKNCTATNGGGIYSPSAVTLYGNTLINSTLSNVINKPYLTEVTSHTHKNLEKTTITSGNLDDYTDTGWYSYSTTNSSSITNTPENIGSIMEVLDDYGDGRYIVQKVYTLPSDNNSIIYYRQKYNTSWGNWKKIIDTDDASITTPLGIRVNTSAITGSSTDYARADHQHTLTQFKCNGTAGSDGYIKVFQIKINSTYQDNPISFSLMQRGTKQSADVNIRFANENSNDPALDSFTFNGSNIGNNGEYYLYKESASTWSFIVRKWDTHDVINIYNMSTTNGSVAITSLNTQVSELPSGCIPASMIKNDLFFKTKNGSTSNYMNLFEIRPTGNYQSKPITFEIVKQTKPTPVYVSVRLTNVTLASNTYAPQTIYAWGTSDTPVYIRKEADNVFNVITFHNANEEISICNMNNPNQSVKITPLGTVYGTDAPATSGDNQVWYHTYTVGGTTFGTGTNNVVRGNDSRLSDARNPKSTKISAGSDLNTYTTTGFYYNNANTDCATITPLPRPNQAFFLQVEDWGTSNYTKQTITHYDPVKTYERIRNAGTWSDWHELQHNDGTGGENLLRTEPRNEGPSGVNYTIADETFHNDKVYYRNETSQDTTKYSGWTWPIPKNEFDYGDVFTLSFYAKGTNGAEIRTYFAGASGYISNRRISSNSDVDNTVSSYGDGATRFHLTSDWKRYYVTYKLHSTATTPTQNKSIHIRTFGASTDIEFYISNVKLERGYYATDYDRRTRDNEPLYFPTEVSLPATTTTELRRKFIHPPYKFKNIPNWTVEGEIKVTGDSARFELHNVGDTNLKNMIAVGKNGVGKLAYWWGTSGNAESSKTYSASDIEVDTWYPFRISRMGNNVLFMFNNDYKHEVTTTYFNTFEDIEPLIFGYGTSGASVRNLKITPLEPSIPSKTSQLTDPSAYNNLGTSTDATQSTINTAIDTKIGELETLIGDAITYINGTGGN